MTLSVLVSPAIAGTVGGAATVSHGSTPTGITPSGLVSAELPDLAELTGLSLTLRGPGSSTTPPTARNLNVTELPGPGGSDSQKPGGPLGNLNPPPGGDLVSEELLPRSSSGTPWGDRLPDGHDGFGGASGGIGGFVPPNPSQGSPIATPLPTGALAGTALLASHTLRRKRNNTR